MKELLHAPLLKLLLFFVLGLWLAELVSGYLAWVLLPAGLGFLGYLGRDRQASRRQEWLLALCIYLCALGLGSLRQSLIAPETGADELAGYNCRPVALAGLAGTPSKATTYGAKTWIEVFAADTGAGWAPTQGRVLLYLGDSVAPIREGDSLFVQTDLRNIYSRYPGYLEYLHQQGIYYSGQADRLERGGAAFSLTRLARHWQETLSHRLAAILPHPEGVGIAQAMFLGDKSGLSPETRDQFAAAGVSHILAISGLHVGIVFLLLGRLTRFLVLIPQGHRLQQLVILLILVGYMGLTGASPAVVRAVLMFGTILVFRMTYYRYHLLNLIAISAWLQLLYDPAILHNIGFQLSYAAVLGIVGLLPRFEALVETPYPWLNKVYATIGVTLVATLATLPLVLTHFGQFPTYFLLANVLVSCLS
ncbi:MAG: ComEC family competence protein, partial [Bacteroidetes bacterium]